MQNLLAVHLGGIPEALKRQPLHVCESCRTIYAKVTDNCPECSTPTPRLRFITSSTAKTPSQEKLFQSAQDTGEILSHTRTLTVLNLKIELHRSSRSGNQSLRIEYLARDKEGHVERFSKWVTFGHPSEWARRQAGLWWRLHTPKGETAPRTAAETFRDTNTHCSARGFRREASAHYTPQVP
jgi:hypothetical protein